jgi:hypothetical protein
MDILARTIDNFPLSPSEGSNSTEYNSFIVNFYWKWWLAGALISIISSRYPAITSEQMKD